ncbi:MAG TPA: MauE/DoxX family redox-associated membrane protein [Actinomycetota bacterium]
MRSSRSPAALHLLCRAVPAALLVWAGLAKAFDHQGSILAVDAYGVLPDAAVRIVAAALPWVEIAVGVLLVLGLFTRVVGAATAVLATVFIAAMGQAKARGLQIDCGCFGGGGAGAGVSWFDILRDVPIALAGAYLAVRPRGPLQLDAYFE